jgi:hypothetical protein
VAVSIWLPDLFVTWGGGLVEITDLSGEMSVILELVTSQGGVNILLLPVFFGVGNRQCW